MIFATRHCRKQQWISCLSDGRGPVFSQRKGADRILCLSGLTALSLPPINVHSTIVFHPKALGRACLVSLAR